MQLFSLMLIIFNMKDVYLYNSLSNKIEKFVPLKDGEVSLYVCGPTVYNDAHLGNIRPAIFFDSLVRFFTYLGYDVKYVSNYTDVDDKIINRAKELGVSEAFVAKENIAKYEEILKNINCLPFYEHPRATEYINNMINYIQDLINNGSAYQIGGDVFFRVNSIEGYGKLSNTNINDLKVGARILSNDKKESPLDFTLWKETKEGIAWDSPFSRGRPGWHTECCVMIEAIFGGTIDIHGGGFDLKFPHHENELAQARAYNHKLLANYWMHNGFVNVGEEKMSKSLGNVILAKDVIKEYGGDAIRYLILSTYYRSPVAFSDAVIRGAKNEVEKIKNAYLRGTSLLQLNGFEINKKYANKMDHYIDALANDLNFANAISEMHNIIKEINTNIRQKEVNYLLLQELISSLKEMLFILGIDNSFPTINDYDKMLYNKYLEYRSKGEYAKSDELRPLLMAKHII